MSDITLPEGKTPDEAAHDVVLALMSSGHFSTAGKNTEEIFLMIQKKEAEYRRLYQQKLELLIRRKEKESEQTWIMLVR